MKLNYFDPKALQDKLDRVKIVLSISKAPTRTKSENRSETETECSMTELERMRSLISALVYLLPFVHLFVLCVNSAMREYSTGSAG